MLKKTIPLCLIAFLFCLPSPGLWGHARFSKPRHFSVDDKSRCNAKRHLDMGLNAFRQQRYHVAARQLKILTRDFHPTFYPAEVHYFLGLSFYQLNELDLANQAWNFYIEKETDALHLDEVMQAKMDIAERCRLGASGRLFGVRSFPKWSNGDTLAMTIYDEILATLPTSDLAAVALVGRGRLFCKQGAYQEAIESLYLMVRRFPQHELTPEAYLAMQEVYLAQGKADGQNPDTLSLAEVALNRFSSHYPKDHRLEQAHQLYAKLRDVQANSLLKTACFYHRIHQPCASILYCKATIRQFPDTPTAERCRILLTHLEPSSPTPTLPSDMPEDLPNYSEDSEDAPSLSEDVPNYSEDVPNFPEEDLPL